MSQRQKLPEQLLGDNDPPLETPPAEGERSQCCRVGPLLFTTLLSSALYAIVFPSMALRLIDKMHASTTFVGLSVSAYSLCKAIVAPVIGRYAAKGLRQPLLLTAFFLIAGSVVYGKRHD